MNFLVALVLMICAQSPKNALDVNQKSDPSIAVMPLIAQGIDSTVSQLTTDALSDEFLKNGSLRVMERSQMEKILKEQGFNGTGACDGNQCAIEIGKLLSIDKMIVGSIGKIGNAYILSIRAINVSSGEVIGSSRIQRKAEIEEITTNLVPAVAKEITTQLHLEASAMTSGGINKNPFMAQKYNSVLQPPVNFSDSEKINLSRIQKFGDRHPVIRWGAVAVSAVGLIIGAYEQMQYNRYKNVANSRYAEISTGTATYAQYKELAWNAKNSGYYAIAGYGISAVGFGIFTLSFAF